MSEAKVPDYDTCGLFHRLHCIKTLASRPVLICKSCYFFARKEAAGILSYSQFRFFVYFTFLFELAESGLIQIISIQLSILLCIDKLYLFHTLFFFSHIFSTNPVPLYFFIIMCSSGGLQVRLLFRE